MSFQRVNVLFNLVLTLFKQSVEIYNSVIKKHASREVLLIKKKVIYKEIVICKEKAETVTKVKLVTKIKKHTIISFVLELWYCYCGDNA